MYDTQASDPVFVDRTGRRRRLFIGFEVAAGLALVTALVLLVTGLQGAAPVPAPGLPARGGHGQQGGQPALSSAPAQPGSRPPTRTARPPSSPGASGAAATGAPAPVSSPIPSSTTRGNRPTVHPGNPGNPRPSKSR